MILNIKSRLFKLSTSKVLVVSSIVFVLFMIFVLPSVSSYTEEITGSTDSPDTSLIYSSSDLFDMAEAYGEEGRDAYIYLRFTFDIIWPIVYFMFMVSMLGVLLKKLNLDKKYGYLIFLPLLGVLFDLLENISTVIVMYNYPTEMIFFSSIAPIMSLTKWVIIGISFCFIIIFSILYLSKKIKK